MGDGLIQILGGSGFIGQNLMKFNRNYESISLRDKNWKNKVLNDQTEVLINLVGKAHDHNRKGAKEEYFHVNLELTKEIFKIFIDSSAKLLLHVSSIAAIEEYESTTPLVENSISNPVSWYGESKREAEIWLLNQYLPLNKKLIILRPPMVHGPGDKGNLGMLYKFISNGIPYPFDSFNNFRSFISINNFVFYIDNILKNYSNLNSGIYHLSDNEPVSTNEIIEIIKTVTNKEVLKFKLPVLLIKLIANIGDLIPIPINNKRLKKLTSTLLVSNSKINSSLNVENLPETGVEGIKRTIEWFKSNN